MSAQDSRVCLHHIGGRSGTTSFPVLPCFEHDFIRVLYDADVDCLPDALTRNQESGAELHVLPHCLGATAGASELNITYDPFNSSLRTSNPRYHAYYSGANPGFDHVFAEMTEVVERRAVQTVPLDDLVRSDAVPAPDFLSIDTEGTEFEILQGARGALRSSVVGLVVEVAFHELFEGQRLFGDVQQLLSLQGFDFVRFLALGELSPYRASIGFRGEGYQTSGDALFFRRHDSFGDFGSAWVSQLRKLAFLAFVFRQFEFGMQCLGAARSESTVSGGPDEHPRRSYDTFLDDVEEAMGAAPTLLPPTFAMRFSLSESKTRCEADPVRTVRDSSLKAAVRTIPWIFEPLRIARRSITRAGHRAGVAAARLGANLPGRRYSPVENVLIGYGLRAQADVLRVRRLPR